ncbi:MAG TPA: DUF2203 domain-containing protein [Candidatus Eisenbacteria bacterium]|jgi:hypothetical protein
MAGSTKVTLFSIEEANRAVAELRPELERLSALKRDFDQLGTRAEVLGLAASGAAADNPDAIELRGITGRRDAIAEEILKGVEAVQRRGCLVKDIARGLVDFYALSGDRLIFLCWQLGEPEIGYWHTLEGGFAGRQPLDAAGRE